MDELFKKVEKQKKTIPLLLLHLTPQRKTKQHIWFYNTEERTVLYGNHMKICTYLEAAETVGGKQQQLDGNKHSDGKQITAAEAWRRMKTDIVAVSCLCPSVGSRPFPIYGSSGNASEVKRSEELLIRLASHHLLLMVMIPDRSGVCLLSWFIPLTHSVLILLLLFYCNSSVAS